MEEISFLVQGSAEEPYKVVFRRDGNNLSALCNCAAGVNGQYCKHRFRILTGHDEDIVTKNRADVGKVAKWLPGTDVEKAIQNLALADLEFEQAKKRISDCKKKLARALRD